MTASPLATGLCATCAFPIIEEHAYGADVDGEHFLFCTDRCVRGFRKTDRLPVPHW